MKETDLLETVRSLLRSDAVNPHRPFTHPSSVEPATEEEDAAEPGSDGSSDGFPVPDGEDAELRDILLELNITTHEYLRKALEHHGGRLRQQEVAELTGWSEATVSQKLSEMEENGHITRFRTGREKIVCLPDESPEDADAAPQ